MKTPLLNRREFVRRTGEQVVACFPLPKGNSHLEWS